MDCPVLRDKKITYREFNMITGESKIGRSEQRVEPCGTPLFGKDFVIGVCKSCRDGWDVEGNRIIQTPENLELIEKAKLLAE